MIKLFTVLATGLLLTATAAASPNVHTALNHVHGCQPVSSDRLLIASDGGALLVDGSGKIRHVLSQRNGLPANRVQAILSEQDTIWIGTERGLVRAALVGDRLVVKSVHSSAAIRDMVRFDGALWLATWRGLATFDGKTIVHVGPRQPTQALMADAKTLWAGTRDGQLRRVRSGVKTVTTEARTPSAAPIWRIIRHKQRLLVGSLLGIVAWNPKHKRWTNVDTADARALLSERGKLIVGSYGDGVFARTQRGRRSIQAKPSFVNQISRGHGLVCVSTRQGVLLGKRLARVRHVKWPALPSNDIAAMVHDGRGSTWIGTFDQGLARKTLKGWRPVGIGQIDPQINALARTAKTIWVGTARGLYQVNGSSIRRYGVSDGLASADIRSLAAHGNTLWVGTAKGLARIEGDQVSQLSGKYGLPSHAIWALAATERAVWMGSQRGLHHLNLKTGKQQRFSVAGGELGDDWVTAITLHKGNVYVGTYNSGVSVLSRVEQRWQSKQIGGGWVNLTGLTAHRSGIWAATMEGLRHWDGRRWHSHKQIGKQDVTAVAFVGKHMWVTTRRGLHRFNAM